MIAGALASWEADPLASVALFLNGLDQLIHAAALIARITAGEDSGAYKVLAAFGLTADYVATLADLVALDPEAAAGEITMPLLGNVKALTAIGALLGVDLTGDIEDFKELINIGK